MFRESRSAMSNRFRVRRRSPEEVRSPGPSGLVTGVPRAIRMAAPPTTWQKLAAEFLGTGFLVFIGAGSAAATGSRGGHEGPSRLPSLG
jgi:hypothetical protein